MVHGLNGEQLQGFYNRQCFCVGCDETDGVDCYIGERVADIMGKTVAEVRNPKRQLATVSNSIIIPLR